MADNMRPRLKAVDTSRDEEGRVLSAQEFFNENVLPFLEKVAKIATDKVAASKYPVLEVSSSMAIELKAILASMALKVPRITFFTRESCWNKNKIVVRLVPYYGCHILLAKGANDGPDSYAPGEEYYLEAAKFFGDEDSYDGQNYWTIKGSIEEKKGVDSVESKNIRKVIQLINDLLFKTVLDEKEREGLADELSTLRMKVGEAAIAVIQDFLRNYTDGDGWVHTAEGDITGGKKAGLVKDSVAYMKAMERLKIGKYDLRKLV